jgi:hypothetical protein
MTINKRSYDSVQPDYSEELERQLPTASVSRVLATGERAESSRRLNDARGYLFRIERESLQDVEDELHRSEDSARELRERAIEVRLEAQSIKSDAQAQANFLARQAKIERDLAERIKEEAERQALSILDRVKDSTDTMINWVGTVAEDTANMMREDAAREVFKKMEDIEAARSAIADEERAEEILDLAARLRRQAA